MAYQEYSLLCYWQAASLLPPSGLAQILSRSSVPSHFWQFWDVPFPRFRYQTEEMMMGSGFGGKRGTGGGHVAAPGHTVPENRSCQLSPFLSLLSVRTVHGKFPSSGLWRRRIKRSILPATSLRAQQSVKKKRVQQTTSQIQWHHPCFLGFSRLWQRFQFYTRQGLIRKSFAKKGLILNPEQAKLQSD